MDKKIHIAGPLVGSIQKCIRCGTRIDFNHKLVIDPPTGWREGSLVLSSGRGMRVLESIAAGIDTRYCGKAAR